jgi:quercetin dioxygenase-like cupin family protein
MTDVPSQDTHTKEKLMEINPNPKQPTAKGPVETFTGNVWVDAIANGEEPSRERVNLVRFSPGARSAWHSHALGQTLHVTEGAGLVQSRGRDIVSRSAPATSSTHPPTRSTGTAPPPTTS